MYRAREPLDCTGMNKISDEQMAQAEKQFKLWESMINSMTPKERETPEVLASTPSRRRRIAKGSGRKELDVSNMIAKFTQMRSMVQNMSRMMKIKGAQGASRHCLQQHEAQHSPCACLQACTPPSFVPSPFV